MSASTQEISPAPPSRRQAESERKRTRILEAAQACLGELGYARATVGEIARRADVSNGLLYQFFKNKEALFEEVLESILREWVREMVPRPEESAGKALEGMFRRSVAFCRTHPLLPAFLRDDPEALRLVEGETNGADDLRLAALYTEYLDASTPQILGEAFFSYAERFGDDMNEALDAYLSER